MPIALYFVGFAIVILGLIYAAHLMHVPQHWIIVFTIVLAGTGILKGARMLSKGSDS